MTRTFNGRKLEPKFIARVVLGTLVAANLVAAGLVMFPPGGSAEDLNRQLEGLQKETVTLRATLERTRKHAEAVQRGKAEGDQFLGEYFLGSRTASSTVLSELGDAAMASKITPRENAFALEPIEGSDSLSMMSVTATYTGKYADLMHFVHEIDKSPRLLIIEGLTAAPQQGSDDLAVSIRLDTFVREDDQGVRQGLLEKTSATGAAAQ